MSSDAERTVFPFPQDEKSLPLDYSLSLQCAMQTRARPHHCYESSYVAFFARSDLFYPDGVFVEGWIVVEDTDRVILMEHGWLVSIKRQCIVDVTLVFQITPQQPVHYFPGVIRSWAETDALENEMFPHVCFSTYGNDGMGHQGYRAAYETARQQAQTLLLPGKQVIEVRATDALTQTDRREDAGLMLMVLLSDAVEQERCLQADDGTPWQSAWKEKRGQA